MNPNFFKKFFVPSRYWLFSSVYYLHIKKCKSKNVFCSWNETNHHIHKIRIGIVGEMIRMEDKKEKVKLRFRFHHSHSKDGKTAEEIIQSLVDSTIKRVLAENEKKYYNRLKEHTS